MGNFGNDPDHRLDTRIIFRIRHYREIYWKWLTDINLLLILIRQMTELVRRNLAEVCTVPVLLVITHPKSWNSFYRPTEGGRLSRPRHYRKGAQPVPNAVHRSGCRHEYNWPRSLTPQSFMPPLTIATCWGVSNLPKVVTRQRRGRELNSQPSSCKSNALTTRLSSHYNSVCAWVDSVVVLCKT